MSFIIPVIIILLIVAGLVSSFISIYNKRIMLKYNVEKSFANIDILLKQRADEIPNLINVVKTFMKYEKQVLNDLTEIRTKFLNTQSIDKKVELSNETSKSLKAIFAVSENYPELKANNSFVELQKRISEIENQISDRREFFNESVNMYNIGIHEFPNFILAKFLNYKDKQLLYITEQEKKYNGVEF